VYYVQFRNGQIVKQRKKHYRGEGIPIENHALKLQGGGDLIVKLLGDSITNVPKIEFLKLHPSDTSSYCLGIDDHATFIEPFTYEPVAIPLDSVTKDIFQESVNHTLTVGNIDAEKRPACFQVSYCDSLKLLASKRTLCITEPLQLTIRKNAACGSLVPLTYVTNAVDTLSHLNDSTVTIQFSKPWAGYISGSLQGCSLLQDSVYVTVLRAPGRLNLGPDTSLCPANTLVLNARSGYAVYQWQDGSADSLFTVKAPGLYHVKVTDACGGVFYDSVRISPRPPVAISIGPDRFKCNTDTVHLSAPTGFLNYSWSPDYKINTTQAQQVVANPAADTFYTLKAEKTPGCFAFDTIHVTVRHSPPIQLGPDTSFCAGSSVLLNAGAGFSHYQWSTGSSGPQLLVQAAGTYSITGTTTDGCRSFDTVTVPHVFPLPHVSLDPEPRLCTGSVRMLDAGAFASYRWQDGSTGRKFRAAGAGTYYVSVTDANACTSSDTTRITTVLALPKNFLPADTAICSYGTLELKPLQPYSAYRWSTNSTQPATVISSPGTYWLQATDSNGCTGSDSTIVHLKDCLKGLYVPTAFTPNNDGKNDQMRAQLFGTIVAYEFTIYNRWGQVVFHTTDSTKGWNGQLKNKDQDTGVYVWTCRYQLAGEPEKAEKGSFVLIR
jgi:gliding motility-associated-like protein